MSKEPLNTYDQDLIAWAHENLNNIPHCQAYHRMICGMDYDGGDKELTLGRILSTEKCDDYAAIRFAQFDNLESFSEARAKFIENLFGDCDSGVWVEPPFRVDYGFNIKVGKNFYTNFNVSILDCAIVEIGDDVCIGPNVMITTACHPIEPVSRRARVEFALPIKIEDNVWIGGNAVILPGVTIGKNSVIAAGAVVSKNVPANTVYGGVPAKLIKNI